MPLRFFYLFMNKFFVNDYGFDTESIKMFGAYIEDNMAPSNFGANWICTFGIIRI